MAYPIKYIENNLVFNHDGECFAYYELLPYNYSFLSPEQKYQVHDSFRQLIAQNRDGKIHALQISTESSIRAAQERSKQEVTGKLKDIACAKIDAQTEALISMIGENQVDYRFFIGFKLLVNEQEVTMKQFRREAKTAVSDFLHEVNHKLMGDFVSMSNEEIWRFQKMEKLLESKISRRFKVRRLNKDDFGYLIEHLYGQTGTAYEDYEYYLPKKRFQEETLVKYYDLIKPTRCLIEENQRYLKIEQEDGTVYAAYFTINSIVGELDFPSSEIFYYQQQQFTFPGAVTLGTEDGANVEIHELVGDDNIFVFGASSDEVIEHYAKADYVSKEFYEKNPAIKAAVDFITSKEVLAVGQKENLERLQHEIISKDWFMTLLDFDAYKEKKEEALKRDQADDCDAVPSKQCIYD